MFSIVFALLVLSVGFGVVAFEFPEIQGLMLVAACVTGTAFCGSFEAWSSEDRPVPGARRPSEVGAMDDTSD